MNNPHYSNMYTSSECKSEYCDGYGSDIITDTRRGCVVCTVCGEVQILRRAVEKDWNNYSNEQGVFKDKSRVGWTDPNNPFDTGGTNAIIIKLKSRSNLHNFCLRNAFFW